MFSNIIHIRCLFKIGLAGADLQENCNWVWIFGSCNHCDSLQHAEIIACDVFLSMMSQPREIHRLQLWKVYKFFG